MQSGDGGRDGGMRGDWPAACLVPAEGWACSVRGMGRAWTGRAQGLQLVQGVGWGGGKGGLCKWMFRQWCDRGPWGRCAACGAEGTGCAWRGATFAVVGAGRGSAG